MKKSTLLTLVILGTQFVNINSQGSGTTTPATVTPPNACANNCARCNNTTGCLKCVGKIGNFANNSNGVCDTDITKGGNCASWSLPPHSYCLSCDPGYLINEKNICVKSMTSCCKSGSIVGGQEVCTACENTMPNYHRTKCNEKLDIPNCKWGMRQGQLEACAYCEEGYSVYGYGCVDDCGDGCSQCTRIVQNGLNLKRCVECDWNRGWYMTSEGVCSSGFILSIAWVTFFVLLFSSNSY